MGAKFLSGGLIKRKMIRVILATGVLLGAMQFNLDNSNPFLAQPAWAQMAQNGQTTESQPRRLRRPGMATNSPDLNGAPSQYLEGKPFQLNAEKLHIQADEDSTGEQTEKLQPLVPGAAAAFPPALNGQASQNTLYGRASAMPQTAPPRLQSQTAAGDRAPFRLNADQNGLFDGAQKAPLQGNVSVEILAQYDVELIVDESNSMRQRDCPNGLSRWEWCGMQARNLSNLLAPFVPRGLTLSTFASGYNVFENSKPGDIVELFDQPFFSGGTRLSRPLRDRLSNYFRTRKPGSKPVLIGVITDGVPVPRTEPAMVAQTLIQASRQMKTPHEVTVVFFQIGGADRRGRRFLDAMDNQLTSYGAKYDFVQNVTFEELQADGLALSLVKSIKNFAQNQTATR
jgi:hypothetical protein